MDLQIPLPIRLAASSSLEETTATPETPDPPASVQPAPPGPASSLSPNPYPTGNRAAGHTGNAQTPLSPGSRFQAATGPSNHQFWLKDAKVAEDLFTLHRSAQDLVNFASALIGNNDPALGYRPIPVMSDGDVLFMTQLSNDIVRSVNGITSIRQHGTRMRRRRVKHGHPEPPQPTPTPRGDYSAHRSNTTAAARRSREETAGSDGRSRRVRQSIEDDELQQCYKCGRTETPEWRKGPDGLLCNSCGLVYMKQRRKQKMAERAQRAERGEKSGKK
ncbi:hypothetical protein N0V82_005590 [Gnomoniopsis sp. IMI 355080]|nr:hypothetical protein N0V82_005590 [Gnomoniopsis sp. IMI 355080]